MLRKAVDRFFKRYEGIAMFFCLLSAVVSPLADRFKC